MSGITWAALAQIGQQTVRFVITVILARLLTPGEFGLIGMVIIFTDFAALLGEMGLEAAIIQKQDADERHLSSAFWLNVAAGLLLTIIIASCASLIASFFNQSILVPLTVVISFNVIIGSLNIVQNALLSKSMNFRLLAIINITAVSIAGVTAVTMAFLGFGVWSFVANSLLITSVTAMVMWYLSSWRPKFVLDLRAVKDLLGFSSSLLGFNVLSYWTSNIDNLLIGKYVSSFALGIYDRAYSLMSLPLIQISRVLTRVMFPALATIQGDTEKVKQVFLRANRAIALISFPMMIGLLVVARSFILAIYGEKWEAVIVILQILCLNGMVRSVVVTVGWIFLSQGRTDLMFKVGLFSGAVRAIAIVIGLQWGAIGVAIAIVLSGYLILWYPEWAIPGRLINLTFGEMLRNVDSPFYCAVGMSAAVLALGFMLPAEWPHWANLAAQAPFGVAVYAVLIHVFKIRAYCEIRELVIERWRLQYGKSTKT